MAFLPLVSEARASDHEHITQPRNMRSPMSSHITPLLERNRAFAATDTRTRTPRLPFLPHQGLYVITCVDPRVDPAEFLGLRFAEAIVARTVGGRITPGVIQDLSYVGYLVETKAPEGPYFEAAIIHHTECGTGLLADEQLRRGFAQRTGYDEDALADLPVLDPAATVRADVEKVQTDPRISPHITVSGHVYDVHTGLITTIVEPVSPTGSLAGLVSPS
jgi:carbonic anhydrase